jgi:hypothetical protein
MREKVAWAAERGLAPPDHALRLAKEEGEATTAKASCPKCPKKSAAPDITCQHEPEAKSCCQDQGQTPTAKPPAWVIGLFAKKCRGEEPGGIWTAAPAVPPAPPVAWTFDNALSGTLSPTDCSTDPTTGPPPLPPPRP